MAPQSISTSVTGKLNPSCPPPRQTLFQHVCDPYPSYHFRIKLCSLAVYTTQCIIAILVHVLIAHPILTQKLNVLINKQWLFYFHCYTALVIAKVIVQNNNNLINQRTMYFARWHYHLPVCPSRFWFIERLLGAARPLTFASLPKKIKI